MKISDHIQKSLDACDRRELGSALLHACLAIDGTSKKVYPEINEVGKRYRLFIKEQLDIIELMFGGLNLEETVFPFTNNKGEIGMKFEDIIYEKFRCNYAHGNELEKGYDVSLKVKEHCQQFEVNTKNQSMTMPESCIFALGIVCILAAPNKDQQIGNNNYHYHDGINKFVIDRWWGKGECARQIMDFDNLIKVKMDFSNVWPNA